jgi:uncharacterized protein
MAQPGIDSALPTQDEKTMAVFAHVLQLFGGWIAPLVIFLVKRQSRFVSFHALQVLLFRGLYLIVSMVVGAVLVAGFVAFAMQSQTTPHAGLPPMFPVLFLAFWLYFIVWWVVVLALAVIYGIQAGRGEWAEYPMLGKLARKILKIGPGGAPLGEETRP